MAMTLEKLERDLSKYLSKHYRGTEEAYEFNIKIHHPVNVPDQVRKAVGDRELGDYVTMVMQDNLRFFAESLMEDYPWIKDWGQEGRMGGWLVLLTDDAAAADLAEVERADPEDAKEYRKAAEKRLDDLDDIAERVKREMAGLVKLLETVEPYGPLLEREQD